MEIPSDVGTITKDGQSVTLTYYNYDLSFGGNWTCAVSGAAAASDNAESEVKVIADGSLDTTNCDSKSRIHSNIIIVLETG